LKLYEYALRRIALMGLVLLALAVFVFYLTRGLLPPEDALSQFITPRMNDAAKLGLAQQLGVATSSCPSYAAFTAERAGCVVPLWGQFWGWINNVLTGNWGFSQLPGITPGTVTTWQAFAERFPYTAELAISGTFLTIILAVPLGIVSATHANKLPDHLSRIVSLAGYSIPQFWFGYVLQIVFVLYVSLNGSGLFPSNGILPTTCGICLGNPGTITSYTGLPVLDAVLSRNFPYFWDTLVGLALPTITLALTTIGALTRILRSSMVDALHQDYVLLARAKGLRERVVIYRHALRNALLPAVTIAGLILAFLFGGVVVVEYVFSWPGVGAASVAASTSLDINFLELYVLVTALILVVANLGVDLLYAKLDPRIRY
jgi:ABC-type dipeptide/oligopeptide/nickel transport system permease component